MLPISYLPGYLVSPTWYEVSYVLLYPRTAAAVLLGTHFSDDFAVRVSALFYIVPALAAAPPPAAAPAAPATTATANCTICTMRASKCTTTHVP